VGPAWYVAAAWLALAVLAQSTIVHYFAIRNVVPSLVLAVVVWYAIRVDARRAALFGLVAGLCEDALSAQSGAGWTIATSLSGLLASVLSRGFFADSIPLVIAITMVATLARALVFWVVEALGGYPAGLGGLHFHEAVIASVLNAIVMVLAMVVVRRFDPERR
jgi:rod shape-determining protein MreD